MDDLTDEELTALEKAVWYTCGMAGFYGGFFCSPIEQNRTFALAPLAAQAVRKLKERRQEEKK